MLQRTGPIPEACAGNITAAIEKWPNYNRLKSAIVDSDGLNEMNITGRNAKEMFANIDDTTFDNPINA